MKGTGARLSELVSQIDWGCITIIAFHRGIVQIDCSIAAGIH
jgi:hypothetical protein